MFVPSLYKESPAMSALKKTLKCPFWQKLCYLQKMQKQTMCEAKNHSVQLECVLDACAGLSKMEYTTGYKLRRGEENRIKLCYLLTVLEISIYM